MRFDVIPETFCRVQDRSLCENFYDNGENKNKYIQRLPPADYKRVDLDDGPIPNSNYFRRSLFYRVPFPDIVFFFPSNGRYVERRYHARPIR